MSKRVNKLWSTLTQANYISSQPSTQFPFRMPQQSRVNRGPQANQPWAKSPNQGLVDQSNKNIPKFRK